MTIDKEVVREVIQSIYADYDDEFGETIDERPIKEMIIDKLLEEYELTKEMPDELGVWTVYEDIVFMHEEKNTQRIADTIEGSDFGLEFRNKDNTQFGVMLSCMSGKLFKVALFDDKGIFSHKSANTTLEIAKYLEEYSISEVNQSPKFEQLSETDAFINSTAMFMDKNKATRFNI